MFEMTEELKTGNALIDSEHTELFSRLNTLIMYCLSGNQEGVDESIEFLMNYVDNHFEHEETLQKNWHYPGYERHRRIHEHLKATGKRIQAEYLQGGFSYEITAKIIIRLGGAIVAHIKFEDKIFAEFLAKKNQLKFTNF